MGCGFVGEPRDVGRFLDLGRVWVWGWWVAKGAKKTPPAIGDLFAPRPSQSPALDEVDDGDEHGDGFESLDFEYLGGVRVSGSVLWCDADRRRDVSFMSSARVNFRLKSRRIIATAPSIRLLTKGSAKLDAISSPFGRSFALGSLDLTMFPSGHLLGGAQLLVGRGDRRLLYAGDISPRKMRTAEAFQSVPCDVLAVAATYGHERFRFPPREEVFSRLRLFVDACLEAKETPVLLADPLGSAPEVVDFFSDLGYRIRAHRSVFEVVKAYRDFGYHFEKVKRFQGVATRDEMVVAPPILRTHTSIKNLKNPKTALITGRALDDAFVERHKVDASFPLSEAADYDELVAFIRETGASTIYLTGGHVEPLLDKLRALGLRASGLLPPRQLPLF